MPSAEQQAFWSAIRANPLDDTPRLVYADWLDEHGDADRAEFIRVQCELERLGPAPPPVAEVPLTDLAEFMRNLKALPPEERQQALAGRKQAMAEQKQTAERAAKGSAKWQLLLAREKDLFDRNWQRWVEPIRHALELHATGDQLRIDFARELQDVVTRRGELPPNQLDCHLLMQPRGEVWREKATIAFRRGFVAPLRLKDYPAYWFVAADEWIEEPFVIEEVHGGVMERNDRYEPADDERLAAIAGWVRGDCVARLRFHGISDRTVHTIVSGGRLTRLEQLMFLWGRMTDDGVTELASSPLFGGLKSLGFGQSHIGDRGAFALADSPHLGGLERLEIRNNPIGESGRQRLRDRFGDRVHLGPDE